MRRRVLVVDDELDVGRYFCRLLRDCDVEHAMRGADALLRLGEGRRYDVLFLDVQLEDTHGAQLAEAIGRRWPEQAARIVFMTGGDPDVVKKDFLDHRVLGKPFNAAALRRIVGSERQ